MSTPSVIGALRVVLGADTAQLDTAFKDSVKKAAQFGVDMGKAAATAVAAFAAVGAAVAHAVTNALGEITQMSRLSQSIGVPIEQLQMLKHAAEQSGVSLQTLGQGFKDLAQKMNEAAGDKASGPARAFTALGVSITDASGRLKSSEQVMLDVAQKFSGLQDGANKTALAVHMFGESGAQLIPFLNQGRDGISQLGDQARQFGLVLDGQTIAAADRFNVNLQQIWKTKDALATMLAAKLAPALERLSERFLAYVTDAKKSDEMTSLLVGSFKVLVTTLEIVGAGIAIVRTVLSNLWASLTNDRSIEDVAARMQKIFAEIKGTVGGTAQEIIQTWNGWAPTVTKAADTTVKALAPAIESSAQMAERLARARAELQALVQAPTDNFAEKMVAIQNAVNAGLIPVSQSIQMTTQVYGQMRTEARATLDELVNAPLETYTTKMQAVQGALQDGTISMREYGKTTKAINEENVGHMQALASAVSSSLTAIFGKSKTAAIASAVINTAQAVTKNLSQYPQPYGGIMAALAAATGAAQIAQIKSTNLSSGGSAAPAPAPSAPAPAAAAEPAASSLAGPAGLNQTLTVSGLDAGQFFGGEAVRRLAEKLLDYQRNGGTVVLGSR